MQDTRQHVLLVAGGGIGGLAAALGAARAGWDVELCERAPAFTEVGAGVQLGPNAVRCLHAWGLEAALRGVAAYPDRLQVRSALSGRALAAMPLGPAIAARYGAPYLAIHRADLHGLLLAAVRPLPGVHLHQSETIANHTDSGQGVVLRTAAGHQLHGDAFIGADGLRSATRARLLGEAPARVSGHLAYRTVVAQASLPQRLRTAQVTAWLGPGLHVVQYPVRRGELMNIVAIRHGRPPDDLDHWDHAANAGDLEGALRGTCTALQDLVRAVPQAGAGWRLWPLCDRDPVGGAHEMARGRVALLGDAAHPMRPYLAQGAGMAIEDAAVLQDVLAQAGIGVPERLQRYAARRWQRSARVQRRAERNGRIFHATGPVRWARDLSLRLLGERLLDQPWLYRAPGGAALPGGAGSSR
ncbi:FAD-dependent monooxygenase [Acidovorax sp. GBBC 3334]|uniref:FAD-dependent monooxygenase n=1 Tax=Acidovorax sp. GBBC 3334 TaxID=2940496 RepID=UPI002303BAE0|nr:FAD-dependent monooxygenase [Acidovorax sp. GBBC 3334]MDA8454540.1 FAD-dependent monooxygenase [Acidovorax sp. GBBC 3334]